MDGVRLLVIILPVLLAGLVQILVIRFDPVPRSAIPLDLGRSWRGRRIFGAHKTWRGVVVMAVSSALACALVFRWWPPAPEPAMGWWWFGLLLGLGYCAAELPNSFVKRRLGIDAGARTGRHGAWQDLADQGDSMLGMMIVIGLTLTVEWTWLLLLLVIGVALHVVVDRAMHATGVKSPERSGVR